MRVGATALVVEHLANVNLGVESDPIARQNSRLPWPTGRANAVRSVTMTVLNRLAGDEGLTHDVSTGKVRMTEVHAGIENRHANALPTEMG